MRLIDADELLDKIGEPNERSQKIFMQRDVIKIINNMPVIEQKHGHWKSKKYCTYICSNCGFDYFDDILKEHTKAELSNISKYCPVCGVKMEGVEYYE